MKHYFIVLGLLLGACGQDMAEPQSREQHAACGDHGSKKAHLSELEWQELTPAGVRTLDPHAFVHGAPVSIIARWTWVYINKLSPEQVGAILATSIRFAVKPDVFEFIFCHSIQILLG